MAAPFAEGTMKKKDLIEKIISREWDFFQKVQNEGGRAGCQDDAETFRIMRESQFLTWDEETLSGYLEDIKAAEKEGRNPLAEKYAYMMRSTAPAAYEKIRSLLPEISAEKERAVSAIAEIHLGWREEFEQRFPLLSGKGRPLRTEEDTPAAVSFETYLKGELYTFSEKTLNQYKRLLCERKAEGRNLCMETMENTVRFYGFRSLKEAEEKQGGS